MAESPDGETLLVGEAKLSLTKTEAAHVRAEQKVKAALLPFAKDYRRVATKLFVCVSTPNLRQYPEIAQQFTIAQP